MQRRREVAMDKIQTNTIESDLDENDDEKASDSKPHVYHRCGCIEMMKKGRVLPRMAALPVS
jgi:hypothetical protein